MKSKILFLILMLFLGFNVGYCEEFVMPTDEEIMAIIDKYGFSDEQKQYLLKETKKTIQETLLNNGSEKTKTKTKKEDKE